MGIMGLTVCCTIDYYSPGESGNSAPVQADNGDNVGVERNSKRLQSQTLSICEFKTKIEGCLDQLYPRLLQLCSGGLSVQEPMVTLAGSPGSNLDQ